MWLKRRSLYVVLKLGGPRNLDVPFLSGCWCRQLIAASSGLGSSIDLSDQTVLTARSLPEVAEVDTSLLRRRDFLLPELLKKPSFVVPPSKVDIAVDNHNRDSPTHPRCPGSPLVKGTWKKRQKKQYLEIWICRITCGYLLEFGRGRVVAPLRG